MNIQLNGFQYFWHSTSKHYKGKIPQKIKITVIELGYIKTSNFNQGKFCLDIRGKQYLDRLQN